jgi:hypothetical protein
MSLVGEAYKCIHIINSLQALTYVRFRLVIVIAVLTRTQSDKNASSSFLRDAKRFALRFQSMIQDAPLQLYSSALIFAPEMSIVRRAFTDHIPE